MVVAIIALVFSVTGAGVASVATISALSKKEKKQTTKIVRNLAPTLSVQSAAVGGLGRSQNEVGFCSPPSSDFFPCVTVHLDLPTTSRVLVLGRAKLTGAGPSGECRLASPAGTVKDSNVSASVSGDNFSVQGVTEPLPAGPANFVMQCSRDGGTVSYFQPHITAVGLSGG